MNVTHPLHSYGYAEPYEYDTPKTLYDVRLGAAEHLGYSWCKGVARNAESVLYFSPS